MTGVGSRGEHQMLWSQAYSRLDFLGCFANVNRLIELGRDMCFKLYVN